MKNLALEAETAITLLPTSDRDYYRKRVADKIKTMNAKNHPLRNRGPPSEIHVIKSIKEKLRENNAMIAQADKGKSIVILPLDQYTEKVQNFISNNQFQISKKDPTNTFQKQIKKTINQSKTLIPPDSRWKYINIKPSAPTFKGLIKLHKPDHPIRPVVNWRNAPAHKLAKLFTQTMSRLNPLLYTYNIMNSMHLIQSLTNTPILPSYKFASLDITNMYSNIPTSDTRQILSNMLHANTTNPQENLEILTWFDTIMQQNYFTTDNQIVTQKDGLAMGAPSSSILSEIFLQHLECSHISTLSKKHNIIQYYRYVDDILILYDSDHTDGQTILTDFNEIHPNLQFTIETEHDNSINYLDLSINRTPHNIRIAIHRKPTFTDTIIPYSSNHPPQHKFAAVRYLYNRLHTYQLQQEDYDQEENTIHNILHNNSFPIKPHAHPKKRTLTQTQDNATPQKQKWATFTYIGKETTRITNLFKHTNIKIAFRTNNTVQKLLTHSCYTKDKYSASGIYKLTCPECNKAYVGQTGRSFSQRYQEHHRAFRLDHQSSGFTLHLAEHQHPFGPINEIMQILHFQHKSTHMNTLERYYIHKETANNNQLNDKHTVFPNTIFDTLLDYYP